MRFQHIKGKEKMLHTSCIRILQKKTEQVGYREIILKEIYYEELAHVIMEVDKSHNPKDRGP